MSQPVPNQHTSTCIACGQSDNHPKHRHDPGFGPVVGDLFFHMDCHSRMNPSCEICTTQIAHAAGATGDALRTHLTGE